VDSWALQSFDQANIVEFRGTSGRLAYFGDALILLLTTVAARTGQRRTHPLMYLPDPHHLDLVYVFAANYGADTHPGWYHNLLAHPNDVRVEIGRGTCTAKPAVVPERQRRALSHMQTQHSPVNKPRPPDRSPSSPCIYTTDPPPR
jgi:deazaflavin-dependent oxidoreductase (nitroreductase family)